MYYIGIDLGGTNIAVGVVDSEGRIVAKAETPTLAQRPYQEVIRDMALCSRQAIKNANISEDEVASIGIGIPGVARDGVIIFCTNLGWHDIPMEAELRKYIDKPVYMDNDATVAGWAEHQAGVSRGTNSSVFLTLGTGVGAGIVLNGKIWAGEHGAGSELGHVVLVAGGDLCTCGKRGCTERYCSATAIIRMAKEACAKNPENAIMAAAGGDPEKINAKIVIDAAKAGDPVATEVFDKYAHYLALAVNNVISFFDPDMIILGGGVSRAGDFLLKAVKDRLPEYLFYPTLKQPELVLASLGNDAGIIGAALLGQ
ncbi:MAG: ROK family protein [Clostridia bacterium]|nr:ROK family protein [Clostridia bacterium]